MSNEAFNPNNNGDAIERDPHKMNNDVIRIQLNIVRPSEGGLLFDFSFRTRVRSFFAVNGIPICAKVSSPQGKSGFDE